MLSSSNYNFEGSDDENSDDENFDNAFDDAFDQHFDQTFENLVRAYGGQEEERPEMKNAFISKKIVKQAIYIYGMIISVKLRRILKIYSGDVLE